MNRSSEFIKNIALFGGFPTQKCVNEFEKLGVKYFINLTCDGEKGITPYTTKYTYIHYPISDLRIPTCWKSFSKFIIRIGNIIKCINKGEKIYIHCKGGHGRSGIVVASLLCYLYKITPSEAITKTTEYHNSRKEMKEKWRKIGCPQTRGQKHFITKFFEPLYIYKNYNNYFSVGFNNNAKLNVMIPGFGLFPSANAAFHALKYPSNITYVSQLESALDDNEVEKIVKNYPQPHDWDDIKDSIMSNVLTYKFKQHIKIRQHLLQTGLRPIIIKSNDMYWGKNDICGKNILGKLLSKLREEFYLLY